MTLRDWAGRLVHCRPFERPWMAEYIDCTLGADAKHTRHRLGWEPRPRLAVLRRMPFLIENSRTHPLEWEQRNEAAMRVELVHENLRVHWLLEVHQEEICAAVAERLLNPPPNTRHLLYERIPRHELDWYNRLALHSLMSAIRTREKGLFMSHCRDLAKRRIEQGLSLADVRTALTVLNETCIKALLTAGEPVKPELLDDLISSTIQFGLDEVEDVYETEEALQSQRSPEELK